MRKASQNHQRSVTTLRRQVPEACVTRLCLYLRELTHLDRQRVDYVSSRRLAEQLGLTDTQVRRDFSYFGQFGTSGRGYDVKRLSDRLTLILGVAQRTWNAALVGVGNLGLALLAYQGFRERGFLIRFAVDTDPQKIGRSIREIPIAASQELASLVRQHQIHIGIITVPADSAQAVCRQLIEGGVRGIVNFAPVHLEVPSDVLLRNVDLAVELESLAFYLAHGSP